MTENEKEIQKYADHEILKEFRRRFFESVLHEASFQGVLQIIGLDVTKRWLKEMHNLTTRKAR